MLLPALNSAREKARRISCTSNLKQIGLAAKQYSGDFSEKFPCGWKYYSTKNQNWNGGTNTKFHNGPSATLLMSQNYLTDYKTFVCPSGTLNGATLAEKVSGLDANDYQLSCGGAGSENLSKTNLGYSFIAGMNENDSPDSGMIFDCGYEAVTSKSNHDKYGNICFVDGSARGEAGDTWTAKIAFYGKSTGSPTMNGGTATGTFDKTTGKAPTNLDGQLTSTAVE